jgi:ketosteroid isomerase-like protein
VSQKEAEELVGRLHDAFSHRDREAWIAGWAEQCEYRPAMERGMAGDEDSYRGHEGLRRWWQEMIDAWRNLRSEVHEVRAVGDRVFVSLTLHGEGRLSGAEMEAPFFQVGTIRRGKVLTCQDYADRDEALKATGVKE